jgi:ribonuclease Z
VANFSTTQHNLTEGRMPPTGAARAKFYFQIVTTPTSDTPGTTILLHFDNKRYLFGSIAEGTQRACVQRGIKLKHVRDIFITGQAQWRDIGGLFGMILTMADIQKLEGTGDEPAEKPRLGIHGAPLLTHAIACGRRFIFRTGMPVSVTEFEDFERKPLEEPSWSDDNIQVWAVPAYGLPDSSQSQSQEVHSDPETYSDSSATSSPRKRKHDEFKESGPPGPNVLLDSDEQAIRRSVVSDMFESSWRHDKLVETIWAEVQQPAQMFIRDPDKHKLIPFKLPLTASIPPNQRVLVREPWPAALLTDLPTPPKSFSQPAISYIIRGYRQRGAFNPKRAVELGVPPGPLFKKLVDGHSLTLDNGNVVRPEMVLGPTKPGRGIAIIDIPKLNMVDDILNRPAWKSEKIMNGVEAMCWILGPGVAADSRIQTFMESAPKVKHIISSTDLCPDYLAMDSSAASAIRLSRISRDHFPVPVHDNRTVPQAPSMGLKTTTALDSKLAAHAAERGLKIQVEPKFEVQRDEVVPWLDTAQAIKDIPQKVHRLAQIARTELDGQMAHQARESANGMASAQFADHEVITLGTGSALPSKYRNVSATLLRIPGKGSYLFDCGENTIGQLLRVFGPEKLADVLLDLKLIWISHLHADHHLGTMGVLKAWNLAREKLSAKNKLGKRIWIASEEKMMSFLNDFKPLSSCKKVKYLICNPWSPVMVDGKRANFDQLSHLHIKKFATASVKHCWGAQAVSITFDDGFKFSYSGDCRPSSYFATIGKNSDVLVHEATFDDGMEGDAMAKKHSTTREALAVASLMRAKNVILTHFSQRYQKIPVMGNVKLPQQVKFEDETPSSGAVPESVNEAVDMDVMTAQATNSAANKASPKASSGSPKQDNKKGSDWFAEMAVWTPQTSEEQNGVDPESEQLASTARVCPSWPGDNTSAIPLDELQPKPPGDMNVCVGFDYMRVRVADIKHMSKFTPALTALFESEHPEIADAAVTERDKNAMINNTGRKPSNKMISKNGNGSLPENAQKEDSSDTESSGEGKSRRQEKREKRMQAGGERKRSEAKKQREQDQHREAKMQKERRRGGSDIEAADEEMKQVLTQGEKATEKTEQLASTG